MGVIKMKKISHIMLALLLSFILIGPLGADSGDAAHPHSIINLD
jgi:hypothetical protein